MVLFAGDVVEVDGHIGRYSGFNIFGGRITILNLLTKAEVGDWPSLGSWGRDTQVRVLQEDCLGHCYDDIVINPDNSTFRQRE